VTTTELTVQLYRERGYMTAVVEKWVPHRSIRQDLFGIGDVIAVHPNRTGCTLIQCTTVDHVNDRWQKCITSPSLSTWLAAGNAFTIIGWEQRRSEGGQRLLWRHIEKPVTDGLRRSTTGSKQPAGCG